MKNQIKTLRLLATLLMMVGSTSCSPDEIETDTDAIEDTPVVNSPQLKRGNMYYFEGKEFSELEREAFSAIPSNIKYSYIGGNEDIYVFDNPSDAQSFYKGEFQKIRTLNTASRKKLASRVVGSEYV